MEGQCEELFGKALTPSLRDQIILQSKCAIRPGIAFDFSKEHILQSVDDILNRLRTDYLDILLLHRADTLMEPEEVADAFHTLKAAGKVRHFGVSNQTPMQIELLNKYLDEPLLINQLQFSIAHCPMINSGINANMYNDSAINRDGGILEYCRLKDITIQAWSPFQYGMFEGVFLGNEKFPELNKVINELAMRGVEVITEDTHVSGHACQEEIKLIYSLLHPKFALPVHGEYRHLMAQRNLAISMGIPKENVILMRSGDVIEIGDEGYRVADHVQAGGILVDGLGIGDVGNIVLRDRQNLAQNGIIIVVLTLEKYSNQLLAGPDIVSRGFVYVRESEDLMEEAQRIVDEAVQGCLEKHVSDWGKIKNIIRDSLSDFLWKKMKRNPMILPIIMEV